MGMEAHKNDGEYFFKALPDNHVENNPYKILFGQGDWTSSMQNLAIGVDFRAHI
jgi:hypothetical protein